jgi:S-adenosylmethionine-dependent methyltransferase
MKMTANDESERFRTGAAKYAAYLDTPEGQLRLELAFANLRDFLPLNIRSLQALDIGGGTGANAVRLAQLGIHVTLLDSSAEMLNLAEHAARASGLSRQIELKDGDATQIPKLFAAKSFDLIICHNILEFVEDPDSVLRDAAFALRDRYSIISILVRNQAGDVLKAALRDGDLAAAGQNLTAEWGVESLYGGSVRLFRRENLQGMLKEAKLATIAEQGVRCIADYLPPQVSRSAEYDRILDLERKMGGRPEFAAIARYAQCIAHRLPAVSEDGA